MITLFFWFTWSFIASIGIKYVAMQLLNVELTLLNAFLILLVYQWIRFVKPINKTEFNKINNDKSKKQNINNNSLSEFNKIINNNFNKKNKGSK